MRVELFSFQKRALADIRMKTAEAMGSYHRTHSPQVVSFTAPTGAGVLVPIKSQKNNIYVTIYINYNFINERFPKSVFL